MFTFIDVIVFCFVSVTVIKYYGPKQESVWLTVPKRESMRSGQHGGSIRAGLANHFSSARRKPRVQTLSGWEEVETHSPPPPHPSDALPLAELRFLSFRTSPHSGSPNQLRTKCSDP